MVIQIGDVVMMMSVSEGLSHYSSTAMTYHHTLS